MDARRYMLLPLFLAGLAGAATVRAEGSGCAAPDPDVDVATVARLVPALETFTLANGLRVVLAPRRDESSVSVRVAYEVGARDEAAGRGGLAHFFEHMMFKGSARVPDGGHFRLVRDVGGTTNAATDYDTTQYWNTVPTEALPRVLFAEADRMRGPRISEASLANQRDAIREETLGLDNLPFVSVASEFLFDLWAGTPYGHSPIGTPEELAEASVADATRFHQTYYGPGNAVLVIAGGFDTARARTEVERHFGPIPAGPVPPPREPAQPTGRVLRVEKTDPLAPFPVYAVIWHAPSAVDADAHAMGVLHDILMGHPEARFDRSIGRDLTLYGFSLPVAYRDLGLLNLVFAPRTFVDFDEILAEIEREIVDMRAKGPSDDEVCHGVRRERAALLARLERNEDLAAVLATGVLLHEDPRAFETGLRNLAALDRARIREVARRYLVDDFNTMEVVPAGAMRWIKPILELLPSAIGASLEERLL